MTQVANIVDAGNHQRLGDHEKKEKHKGQLTSPLKTWRNLAFPTALCNRICPFKFSSASPSPLCFALPNTPGHNRPTMNNDFMWDDSWQPLEGDQYW